MRTFKITLSDDGGNQVYFLEGKVGVNNILNKTYGAIRDVSETGTPELLKLANKYKNHEDMKILTPLKTLEMVLIMAESGRSENIPHDLNGAHYNINISIT